MVIIGVGAGNRVSHGRGVAEIGDLDIAADLLEDGLLRVVPQDGADRESELAQSERGCLADVAAGTDDCDHVRSFVATRCDLERGRHAFSHVQAELLQIRTE